MEQLAREIDPDGRRIHVLPVVNEHFGETVNVSGLLTGHDITEALRTLDAPVEGVLIPASALREGRIYFWMMSLLKICGHRFPPSGLSR